jgi:hypothetical protein
MATRRLVLIVGDDNAGQAPVASLIGGLAPLAAAQPTLQTWDPVALTWETYQPGTNGASVFGPEIALRPAAPGVDPSEVVYTLLCSRPNSALLPNNRVSVGGIDHDNYLPSAARAAHVELRKRITEAVPALSLGGDTVQLDAIVFSFGLNEALFGGNPLAFGDALRLMVDETRAAVEAAASVPAGTFASSRTVFLKLHNALVLGTAQARARWDAVRAATESAAHACGAVVVSTDLVDASQLIGTGVLGAQAQANVGPRLQQAVWGARNNEEPSSPIDVFLLLGDATIAGDAPLLELPTYLQPSAGVLIWDAQAARPSFAALTPPKQNPHVPSGSPVSTFGIEFGFGEAARSHYRRSAYLVKCGIDGFATPSASVTAPVFPFFDARTTSWASGERLAELAVFGWAADGVDALEAAFGLGNVRVRALVVGLGSPDVEASLPRAFEEAQLLVNRTKAWLEKKGWGSPAVVALLPQPTALNGELRDLLKNSGWGWADPSGRATTTAGTLTGQAMLDLGQAAAQASFTSAVETQQQPLFAPTRKRLVDALRLRGVPEDGAAQQLIDESLRLVRTAMFRRIGREGCEKILTYAYKDNAQTDQDYIRLLASTTEIKWVRLELMRIMPMMFVDGNPTNQIWQDEAAFRSAGVSQVEKEIRRIQSEIDEAVAVLAGETPIDENARTSVRVFEPENGSVTAGIQINTL